jgi:hypothetical protein
MAKIVKISKKFYTYFLLAMLLLAFLFPLINATCEGLKVAAKAKPMTKSQVQTKKDDKAAQKIKNVSAAATAIKKEQAQAKLASENPSKGKLPPAKLKPTISTAIPNFK